MSMGFLAELLTAHAGRENRPYSIKQTTQSPAPLSPTELAKSDSPAEHHNGNESGLHAESDPTNVEQSPHAGE